MPEAAISVRENGGRKDAFLCRRPVLAADVCEAPSVLFWQRQCCIPRVRGILIGSRGIHTFRIFVVFSKRLLKGHYIAQTPRNVVPERPPQVPNSSAAGLAPNAGTPPPALWQGAFLPKIRTGS